MTSDHLCHNCHENEGVIPFRTCLGHSVMVCKICLNTSEHGGLNDQMARRYRPKY